MKLTIAEENELIESVDRGAKFLDMDYPGWYKRINRSILDIASPTVCVCGQLFKDEIQPYVWGDQTKNGFDWAADRFPTSRYGFELSDEIYRDVDDPEWMHLDQVQYSFLTELWLEKIEKRLANDGLL